MIAITVNGEAYPAAPGTTLVDLVDERCASHRGIAVAWNGEVVPRSRWSEILVGEGDQVEIVTAAAGG
jgi:sulfur carrier protein